MFRCYFEFLLFFRHLHDRLQCATDIQSLLVKGNSEQTQGTGPGLCCSRVSESSLTHKKTYNFKQSLHMFDIPKIASTTLTGGERLAA